MAETNYAPKDNWEIARKCGEWGESWNHFDAPLARDKTQIYLFFFYFFLFVHCITILVN